MKKRLLPIAVAAALIGAAAGCLPGVASPPPTVLVPPTQPPPPLAAPTATLVSLATVTQSTAPICPESAAGGCTLPTAEERDRFCVKKVPYTVVAFPPGSTYEVLSPGFNCNDEGVHEGMQLISCSGPQLYNFDLKICNPACAATVGQAAPGQCPLGYGFDATRQCCAPATTGQTGCIEVTFGTKACQ